ncbi:MAG: hypothetical protein WC462_00755 [archaeon]
MLTTGLIVQFSLTLIVISFVIIAVSLMIIFLNRKKTLEEKHAEKILHDLELLKQGMQLEKSKPMPKLEIKKGETSLKALLVKKFKSKIEQQLNAKVNVLDFNAKEDNFLALIEISGVKLLLTLDASGKIVDYKKVKQLKQ